MGADCSRMNSLRALGADYRLPEEEEELKSWRRVTPRCRSIERALSVWQSQAKKLSVELGLCGAKCQARAQRQARRLAPQAKGCLLRTAFFRCRSRSAMVKRSSSAKAPPGAASLVCVSSRIWVLKTQPKMFAPRGLTLAGPAVRQPAVLSGLFVVQCQPLLITHHR